MGQASERRESEMELKDEPLYAVLFNISWADNLFRPICEGHNGIVCGLAILFIQLLAR
jgi:hypothetical protein